MLNFKGKRRVDKSDSKEEPETARMDELLRNIEEKPGEIPYVDKLMEIKGIGLVSVSGL